MAISATINKIALNIADMDRHYYQTHELTLAQHPSETDLRFMVRVIAFIVNASELLTFTKGLSTDDEPDLWQKSLTDDIEMWIDLGQPDEKRIKKACGRSKEVIIYTYQEGMATAWWKSIETSLTRFSNLKVVYLDIEGNIEALAKRAMNLQANISDGELALLEDEQSVVVKENVWMASV